MIRSLLFVIESVEIECLAAAAQQPVFARVDGGTLAATQIDATVNKLMEAAHVEWYRDCPFS
jgi:hypothetical protein